MPSGASRVYRPLEDKQYRSWLSITPVANLELDRNALKTGELEIAGIHLMDLQRLKNVSRRRWGDAGASLQSGFGTMFLAPYSKIGPSRPCIKVVAVQDMRCRGANLEGRFLNAVRDSLGVLSCSLWIYRRRDPLSAFGPLESAARGQRIWFFQDLQKPIPVSFGAMAWTTGLIPLRIDHWWIASEKRHRFLRAVESLTTNQTRVTRAWQTAVRRALRLFGEGYLQYDAQQAVLADMITLDLLLFEDREHRKRKIELLESSLDWVRAWPLPGTRWASPENLERLLDIRNKLVHEGHCKDLTARELLLADDILGNLLLFVVRNTADIRCKNDLRSFAEQARARHVLGEPIPRSFARRNKPVTHQWSEQEREQTVSCMAGLSGAG